MKFSQSHRDILAQYFILADLHTAARAMVLGELDDNVSLGGGLLRDAQAISKLPFTPEGIDALRRYETRRCPAFTRCGKEHCDGSVWCQYYNLGGSHGSTGPKYSKTWKHVGLIPARTRKKAMFSMLRQDKMLLRGPR